MLHNILNELPNSINAIDKESRRANTKKAQEFLDREIKELSEEELKKLNSGLSTKNYLLSKGHEGRWILLDRDNAHETTYAARFKYYLQNSNDKIKCIEALERFMNELCQLNFFAELIDKTGINFLDIGAGDGSVALPITKSLNKTGKAKYVGVERETKFAPLIEEKFKSAGIPHTVYSQDFRKILETLAKDQPSIALASHLYTTTKMAEFLPMVFNTLLENGVIILAHDTNVSDAIKFRAKFGNLLRLGGRDCTVEIANAFSQATLNSITTTYESCLKFPELSEDDWQKLKQIKQADYDNHYSTCSQEFQTGKNLIDFVISDKLEAFSDIERNEIIDKFRAYLIENNYQLKSTCKIQVALSPKHTSECEKQFLQLKEKIECLKNIKITSPLSLVYPGTFYNNKQTSISSPIQEETPQIGLNFNNQS